VMGATGLSDKMLKSLLTVEVQEYKQMLILQGIDPAAVEKA
jgi:peptide/nickel transport system permease protein